MIDIGTVIDGMIVETISLDPPEVWLTCDNGHRIWSTPKLILEGGMKIICAECRSDAAVRTKSAQSIIEAQEEIDREDFSRKIT